MSALTIKNLPADLYERLKLAARSNHRSINGEVIATLERSLGFKRIGPEDELAAIRHLRASLALPAIDPAEIADAIRQGRPTLN